jgi:CheY-like chemotaxis protein
MGPKILVVEDERITAEDIKSGLESEGYQVLDMVSSGKAAIKRAGELRPDLILMDIKLKGKMDGIEAAGQIKSLYDIPIIYVTAYSDEYTVEQAKITDSSGHIIKEDSDLVKKPFEEEDLHSIIENTLYRHKMEKDHDILLSAMLKNINEAAGWKLADAIGKDLSEVFTPLSGIKKSYTYEDINEFISNNDIYLKSNQNDNMQVKCEFNVIKADSKHINGYILVFNHFIDK